MLSLKALRRRIASIKNTQQITRTMKMVAAARLRRAQDRIIEARPYADKMLEILQDLTLRTKAELHPLLARREIRKVQLVVISTDRGFCGSFNQNIFRRTERFVREHRDKYDEISLTIIGRKGLDYFRRRDVIILRDYVRKFQELDIGSASTVADDVIRDFTEGKYDAIFLVYNVYQSPLVQRVVVRELLPLEPGEVEPDFYPIEYIYEPSADGVLAELLPQYVEVQILRAFLESTAGEQGARMTAMDAATNNAEEMIDKLNLVYNKARQSTITKEMLEIVSGAEALQQ